MSLDACKSSILFDNIFHYYSFYRALLLLLEQGEWNKTRSKISLEAKTMLQVTN